MFFTFSLFFCSFILYLTFLQFSGVYLHVSSFSLYPCLWLYVALCYSSISLPGSLLSPPTEQAPLPGPPCTVMCSLCLLFVLCHHQARGVWSGSLQEVFVTCSANSEMHKHRKCCFLMRASAECLSLRLVYQKAATWALSLTARVFLSLSASTHFASQHVPSTVINLCFLPYFRIDLHWSGLWNMDAMNCFSLCSYQQESYSNK